MRLAIFSLALMSLTGCSQSNPVPVVDGSTQPKEGNRTPELAKREPAVVAFKFTQEKHTLQKRDSMTASLEARKLYNGYLVEVEMGSNKEKLFLQLDINYGEFWVPSWNTTGAYLNTKAFGSFDWRKSTTFENLNIDYLGDPENRCHGCGLARDQVSFVNGPSLERQEFGVPHYTDYGATLGVLGLASNQTQELLKVLVDAAAFVTYTPAACAAVVYPTIIDQLFLDGQIASRGFSIYCESKDSPDGNVLFGGVDINKFQGALESYPYADEREMFVWTKYIYIGNKSLDTSNVMAGRANVIFDSTTPYSSFNKDVIDKITQMWSGVTLNNLSKDPISCVGERSKMVIFYFDKTVIQVPIYEFIMKADDGHCYTTLRSGFYTPGSSFNKNDTQTGKPNFFYFSF